MEADLLEQEAGHRTLLLLLTMMPRSEGSCLATTSFCTRLQSYKVLFERYQLFTYESTINDTIKEIRRISNFVSSKKLRP